MVGRWLEGVGRRNTVRRLLVELESDVRSTAHGIEEAKVLEQRHLANAEFYRNKVLFLNANLHDARRRIAAIQTTPTADGEN